MDEFNRYRDHGTWCYDFGWHCPMCSPAAFDRQADRRRARRKLKEATRKTLAAPAEVELPGEAGARACP